jgi:hypothetical protein
MSKLKPFLITAGVVLATLFIVSKFAPASLKSAVGIN